jgi:hypothetical protein
VSSPTHPNFLFLRLMPKLKGHNFDTIEVIQAESQAMLKPSENTTSRMHPVLRVPGNRSRGPGSIAGATRFP